ncbi:MAG: CARDB domain-containing protein [Nitrososphaerota archaeon]
MSEKEALSYPPITITTTSPLTTTTTQTYSTQSISTISTEKTTTTPAQLFKVTDLKIYPDVVKVGEKTIISINVENSGTVRGSYEVILRVNGTIVNSKTITLEPGQLIKVEFNYSPGREGIYYIEVNGLTGVLETVKEGEYGNAILYVLMVMLLIMALLVLALVISRRRKRIPPPPP